ncbi:Abi-domain-containing protein [Auriscalpium vulgare]|uniref:Abi-domain-containing protein n=1 Tax=Auriscalpium vulgare TaxID=40419 RepID=A0ACB8RV89_9AGAM|nr:Abi-domain-containing protein [Auriscalpium vulgare]
MSELRVFNAPPLSLATAHLLNVAITLGYVLPLYFTKFMRLFVPAKVNGARPAAYWRDDPAVIKTRLASASLSTAAACYVMYTVISEAWDGTNPDIWESVRIRLGFTAHLDRQGVLVYLVTPLLFLGPLYGHYLGFDLPFMKRWSFKEKVVGTLSSWMGFRNYVVGPLTEELVWRSCIVAAYHLAGASNKYIIFVSPISFGAAHLHHGWETYVRFGRNSQAIQRAFISTLFQFTYTTLFGFHCAFLFLRSGSVFPPIAAHIFCNIMGVPQLGEELRWYPYRRTQIVLMYVGGIIAYVFTMSRWTLGESSLFGFAEKHRCW